MAKRSVDEQEVALGKAIDRRLLSRLVVYLRPYKYLVAAAIVLAIGGALLGAYVPKLTQIAIDEHIVGGDTGGLLQVIAMIIGVMILNALSKYGLAYLMQYVGQRTINTLRVRLFEHLGKLSMRFYDTHPVGQLVTRVTSDIDVLM